MDDRKIAFIACVNDEAEWQECRHYLSLLEIPAGMEAEIIAVWDAQSMAGGYQEGMESSDAKYKVYLHQDTFIINRNFPADMLAVFAADSQIGMLGCVGSRKAEGLSVVNVWNAGKVFHSFNPLLLDYAEDAEGHVEVMAADGLLLATQYDVDWRTDLFSGWHFYDLSQAMEMRRAGKTVVVPFQQTPWCYHDCKMVQMESYCDNISIFLKEYSAESGGVTIKFCEYAEFEKRKEGLRNALYPMLAAGERDALIRFFQEGFPRTLNIVREYRMIADIEKEEAAASFVRRFWGAGCCVEELFGKLGTLRHMIKRLEYDAGDGTEWLFIREHYSDAAIRVAVEEYVWDKKKLALLFQPITEADR